jgi:hypothetical protein
LRREVVSALGRISLHFIGIIVVGPEEYVAIRKTQVGTDLESVRPGEKDST